MGYMRKSTEAEIHRVMKNAIDELTRLGEQVRSLSDENETLRDHEKIMRGLLRNAIATSGRHRIRINELELAAAQKIEVEFHGEPATGKSKPLFPRYVIDDTNQYWYGIQDLLDRDLDIAVFDSEPLRIFLRGCICRPNGRRKMARKSPGMA